MADVCLQYDLAARAVEKLTAVNGTEYVIGSATNVMCNELVLTWNS